MKYLIGVLSVAALLVACGSGSTVTLPGQKKATLVFSAATSASLSTPVKAIRISAVIPAGVSVPLLAGGGKQVDPAVLAALKTGTIMGSYSAPLLRIDVVDSSTNGLGADNIRHFAQAIFPVQDNVTENSFTLLNQGFKASGQIPGNTVDLTNSLKASLKVTIQ